MDSLTLSQEIEADYPRAEVGFPVAWRGHELTHANLVLEGGAMRGLFTAGVLDYLMDRGLFCERVIGVSAGALWCGADVVDGAAFEVEGERFAPVQCFQHPFVRLVAGRVDHTGQQNGVARLERGQVLRGAGGGQFVLHVHQAS